MFKLDRIKKGFAVAAGTLVSSLALAQPVAIDTADAVTQIGNAQTAVIAVGGAIVILAAVAFTYRWVKATFF